MLKIQNEIFKVAKHLNIKEYQQLRFAIKFPLNAANQMSFEQYKESSFAPERFISLDNYTKEILYYLIEKRHFANGLKAIKSSAITFTDKLSVLVDWINPQNSSTVLSDDILFEILNFGFKEAYSELEPYLESILIESSRIGLGKAVALLLQYVSPDVHDNLPFQLACGNGHWEIFQLLYSDPRINPAANDHAAFNLACEYGYYRIVKQLIKDAKIIPNANENYAIRSAANNGHFKICKLLMADDRVDPTACIQSAIRAACHQGHYEICRLLMQNDGVDPSVCQNECIRVAAEHGFTKIVNLLMSDIRVDPSDFDNEALNWASRNRHEDIVRLLSRDPRVNTQAAISLLQLEPKNSQ